MNKPLDTYKEKIDHYQASINKLESKTKQISNQRLLLSIGGIGVSIYIYYAGMAFIAWGIFIITAGIFAWLVSRHHSLNREKSHSEIMLKINQQSLARLTGEWTGFLDTGIEFLDESHPYAGDLDIFGKRSLFQLINTTNSFMGRQILKSNLLSPSHDQLDIMNRQESMQELAEDLDWRQRFQGAGMILEGTGKEPDELITWANSANDHWNRPYLLVWIRISSVSAIILTLLAWLMPQFIPFFVPLVLLLFHGVLILYFRKETAPAFAVAERYQDNIKSFHQMLQLFEERSFNSAKLINLQKKLKNKKNLPAYRQIHLLEKAVDLTYMRFHQLYLIFNIFTLWDLQAMIALERWKKKSGSDLKKWLHALGEVEALTSCTLLAYDHPEWCWPVVEDSAGILRALSLGHPLLPESRVSNDIKINHQGEILLITGSNMSGKSTFLRTIGLNMVMAYLGCPVSAKEFRCSFHNIFTSMRINDNLDTGTSSFFAELLRIKTILQEASQGHPVFFLLDEIFKGTNSRDRHTGAKHLIKKLSSTGAVGLVSTHDLELGDLAEENTQIKNYHFAEYYQNGNIYFDYKLKPGVSTTRNAIFLMKMAGIDID